MKKLFFLAATCCLVMNLMAQNNVITYKASAKLTIYPNSFEPRYAEADHTFADGVGTITFPSEVTIIKDEAFLDCSSLRSITLPATVTSIGNYAFSGCKLSSIILPDSLKSIGEEAFANNSLFSPLTIPDNVEYIGEYAFMSCLFPSIHIGKGVRTIETTAFYLNQFLTSIEVDPANTHYRSIDEVLFTYAKDTLLLYPKGNARTVYVMPDGVKVVGEFAFEYCYKLTSVTISKDVTNIGDYAFQDCNYLTSLVCLATTPPTYFPSYKVFWGVSTTIPVYVPEGCATVYQADNHWKEFSNFVEIEKYLIEVASSQVTNINCNNILGDGTMSYDNTTQTLTLNNTNFSYADGDVIALYDSITIRCEGTNVVECADSIYNNSALSADAKVITISGPGSLLIKARATAVWMNNGLTIKDGCIVTIQSEDDSALSLSGESLTIDGATLIAKGNGIEPTIYGCNALNMLGDVAIRSNHTYNDATHQFLNASGEEATDDIVIGLEGTGIEEINENENQNHNVRKVMHNGQLFILRDGKTYNAQGAKL